MINPSQYQIDQIRREDMQRTVSKSQSTNDNAKGTNILKSVRNQLGETLTNTGRNLQNRYGEMEITGTFPRIENA